MLDFLITAAVGFFGGVFSWFVSGFVFAPIKEAFELRRSAIEKLRSYRKLMPIEKSAQTDVVEALNYRTDLSVAKNEIHNLSARMDSLYITNLQICRLLSWSKSISLGKASHDLRAISHTLPWMESRKSGEFDRHKENLKKHLNILQDTII